MRTLYLNILGGPGVGKSIIAAEVYAALKRRMVLAELAQEVIKWRIYSGKTENISQLGIVQQQGQLLQSLKSKVEVVVADGNLLANGFYNHNAIHDSNVEEVDALIKEKMEEMGDHLNVFLLRDPNAQFETQNRFQGAQEAMELDVKIRAYLTSENIPFVTVPVTPDGLEIDVLVKLLHKNMDGFLNHELSAEDISSKLDDVL